MKLINLLFFTLVLIPGLSSAVTLPNGYYNIIESDMTTSGTVFHNEMEGSSSFTFFSPEAIAYQYQYDSTNKTVGFNNGGTNDWEYEHEMWNNLWIDTANPYIAFSLENYVELFTPTASEYWVMDASFTQMSNLYLWTGTDTDTYNGMTEVENFSKIPVMLTDDADLSLYAELDVETFSDQIPPGAFGPGNPANTVNKDETDVELLLELGLKQGTTALSLADFDAPYHLSVRGFIDYCRNGANDNCAELVQEGLADIMTVDFHGDGSCTVDLFLGNDFAVQRKTSDPLNAPLYIDSFNGKSNVTACSYSVSGTDSLQLSLTIDEDGGSEIETSDFKVSAGHRYLVGIDPYTIVPFIDFNRGTIFGMRKDTALANADFTGTYLGQYQGTIYDNTDDSSTDITTIKHTNRAFAITFDGAGGCTYKEYKNVATAHSYPLSPDSSGIVSANSEYEAACGGGYSIVTVGDHQYVKVVITPGDFIMNGYLSDDGQTISFFKPVAKGVAANTSDGSDGNLPQGDFANTATILKLLNGVAIKYTGDNNSTAAAITAWLNVPTDAAIVPIISYLLF